MTTIVLFRQDLRIGDNPALAHAARHRPVLPVYILNETQPPAGRPIGGAARWWLHHSLSRLECALGGFVLKRGDPAALLPELVRRVGAKRVVRNRCYEPDAIARDKSLKGDLARAGIRVASFNGGLLFDPWTVRTGDGGPYKVYSPFWRACPKLPVPAVLPRPKLTLARVSGLGDRLVDSSLLPTRPNWAKGFETAWVPGERGAVERLTQFLARGLDGYADLRDRPDLPNVSRLSPHLHWGEISPRQVWQAMHLRMGEALALRRDGDKLLAELGWREFAHHLLYHFPALPERNWKPAFDAFP